MIQHLKNSFINLGCHCNSLYLKCITFLSLSHTIFISCYRPNRGEGSPHLPHNWQVDGTQPHGSGGTSPFSGLFGSPLPGILNLSDYVNPPSVPQTTGERSPPSAAAGSAEQLRSVGDEQAPSVRDDITEHEREES